MLSITSGTGSAAGSSTGSSAGSSSVGSAVSSLTSSTVPSIGGSGGCNVSMSSSAILNPAYVFPANESCLLTSCADESGVATKK
ncbi:hypothetical protein FQV28_11200 [Planomicrobium sp. CPCC 101079]|nr:hypothetical protein FQV28_11200 [Planomicrobium sp. CPCC 101079]